MPEHPNRHHYIPCFYTKRWTGTDGKLTVFRLVHQGKVVALRKAPAGTGYVDGLYRMPGYSEDRAQIIEENFFRPVDTHANEFLEEMERGTVSGDFKKRSAWARYLMSLLFRTPEEISATIRLLRSDFQRVTPAMRAKYKKQRRPQDPETLEEFMSLDDGTVERKALTTLTRSANSAKIGEMLVNMRWGIMSLPVDVPALMTSDRPLILANGLSDPDCELILPVSPKSFFFAVKTIEARERLRSFNPHAFGEYINESVVRRAVEYVYSASEAPAEYVRRNFGREPETARADAVEQARAARRLPGRRRRERTLCGRQAVRTRVRA